MSEPEAPHPCVIAFDFDDLPDMLTQAEALWYLTSLTYAYALGIGYLTLMGEPDHKAAYNLERAAEFIERGVRRAYGAGEAEFLISMARKKAREGVARQKAAQDAAEAEEVAHAAQG